MTTWPDGGLLRIEDFELGNLLSLPKAPNIRGGVVGHTDYRASLREKRDSAASRWSISYLVLSCKIRDSR